MRNEIGDLFQKGDEGDLQSLEQAKAMFTREIMILSDDTTFVFQQMKANQLAGFEKLFENIDFTAVAVMGHSLGGAAALETCKKSKDIRAGINIDGGLWQPVERLASVSQPVLTITAKTATESAKEEWQRFGEMHRETATRIDIPNATHMDFSIMPLDPEIASKSEKPREYFREYIDKQAKPFNFSKLHLANGSFQSVTV